MFHVLLDVDWVLTAVGHTLVVFDRLLNRCGFFIASLIRAIVIALNGFQMWYSVTVFVSVWLWNRRVTVLVSVWRVVRNGHCWRNVL